MPTSVGLGLANQPGTSSSIHAAKTRKVSSPLPWLVTRSLKTTVSPTSADSLDSPTMLTEKAYVWRSFMMAMAGARSRSGSDSAVAFTVIWQVVPALPFPETMTSTSM